MIEPLHIDSNWDGSETENKSLSHVGALCMLLYNVSVDKSSAKCIIIVKKKKIVLGSNVPK